MSGGARLREPWDSPVWGVLFSAVAVIAGGAVAVIAVNALLPGGQGPDEFLPVRTQSHTAGTVRIVCVTEGSRLDAGTGSRIPLNLNRAPAAGDVYRVTCRGAGR